MRDLFDPVTLGGRTFSYSLAPGAIATFTLLSGRAAGSAADR